MVRVKTVFLKYHKVNSSKVAKLNWDSEHTEAVIAWTVKRALIKLRIVNRHFEYKKETVAHSLSLNKKKNYSA